MFRQPIDLDEHLKNLTAWWRRENHARPQFCLSVVSEPEPDLNAFWPTPEAEPDLEGMVQADIRWAQGVRHLADPYPFVGHSWGRRGTPMTMAAYLGGKVRFSDDTVWIEPVVEDWEKFPLAFDPGNPWVRRSRRLLETQVKRFPDGLLPLLPDFGDALTVFSLLRGTERLLIDLVEQPEIVERKVLEYVGIWPEAHRHFWDIYRRRFAGDCSYLGWAPGKTYICQSDFSTMISPAMFQRFVVPEIERLGAYLEYMPWHLDGPDEIKHLDALLELPQIQAVQIHPGTNRPPCASPLWLPHAERIQAKGHCLLVSAGTVDELETLLDTLAPEGLFIAVHAALATEAQVAPFLKVLEKYSNTPRTELQPSASYQETVTERNPR